MRKSKTATKLRENRVVRICGLGHFIPPFLRHAAEFGYDCVWLDLEHRAMESRELQTLLAISHIADVDCMVRVPLVDGAQLYRVLEDGASGLMFPLVNTPERARQIVQNVKFPPIGSRGMDGAGLDGDYYLQSDGDYAGDANRETFVVVQIETPEAVQNAEAIASVDGVDALFIGPADMTLRLEHHLGDLDMAGVEDEVARAAANAGKSWGRPCAEDQLEGLMRKGAQLLVQGSEFLGFMNELRRGCATFDRLLAHEPS